MDLESREYNGRWYTDVKAWKVSKEQVSSNNEEPNEDHDHYETEKENKLSLNDGDIPFEVIITWWFGTRAQLGASFSVYRNVGVQLPPPLLLSGTFMIHAK